MTSRKNLNLIAPVGLAGSGKSSAVKYLTAMGYPKIYFGGIIYKAMDEAGIERTWDNQERFREDIRAREGKDFVVKRAIQEIHNLANAGQHTIILDGLYTWSEYRILKHEFPGNLTTIAIVTPKHLRYKRMASRPERPMTPDEIDQRDWSDIENLEKGGPIAIADHFVINDKDQAHLEAQIRALVK